MDDIRAVDESDAWRLLDEVMDFGEGVDRRLTLRELEVDSISVLEWLYSMDEDFDLKLDLDGEEIFVDIDGLRVDQVVDRINSFLKTNAE